MSFDECIYYPFLQSEQILIKFSNINLLRFSGDDDDDNQNFKSSWKNKSKVIKNKFSCKANLENIININVCSVMNLPREILMFFNPTSVKPSYA